MKLLSAIFVCLLATEIPSFVHARSISLDTGSEPHDDVYRGINDVRKGEFNVPQTGSVTAKDGITYAFSYDFFVNQEWTSYVCVTSRNATDNTPLVVVVRQSVSVLSWEIPLTLLKSHLKHSEVCHTLCPLKHYVDASVKDGPQTIHVDLTTSSTKPIAFDLLVKNISDFLLQDETSFNITPSTPHVFEYHIPDNVDSVLVEAHSNGSECMIMAIQDIQCPFYDSERNVEYKGFYQTMTRQSGITVTRNSFKSGKVYIVAILKATDEECTDHYKAESHVARVKFLNLTVQHSVSEKDIYIATFSAVGFYVFLYIFSFIICIFLFYRRRKLTARGPELQAVSTREGSVQSYGAVSDQPNSARTVELGSVGTRSLRNPASSGESDVSSPGTDVYTIRAPGDEMGDVDDTDYDKLPEVERDKNIVRTKTILYVSDLSKNESYSVDRTKVYSWNLMTVAVFYGLPVVQLVYINQNIVNMTGNQDLCYYNFLCSHQVWVFSDFNHVFSNIGYVMLGFLFLLLVWRREVMHMMSRDKFKEEGGGELPGIPHHFGLFYAMAIALIMEGVLSASYHVCPNKANFQFDTAFMYVIATVCMLKLYQARHPDITAKSHHTWMILAVVLLIGVVGVLQGGTIFWVLFVLGHITIVFTVSTSIYYMGRWSVDRHVLRRLLQNIKLDIAARSFWPTYMGRFVMLSTAVIINISLDLFGLITRPSNFAAFLLSVFIVNLLLYLIYYTLMKVRYKERIRWIPIMYIVLSFVCWGAALKFFLMKSTSWKMTPALSRERNKPCVLLNFFDYHDIWHFFSSCALFFSFMVLFTLDDDLENTPRSSIIVF